jgi:acyl carrier protein
MHPDLELTDDEDLLAKGVIDSLGFVELVEEVQSRYSVAVQDVEITEENFGSINAIAGFVDRKRSAA